MAIIVRSKERRRKSKRKKQSKDKDLRIKEENSENTKFRGDEEAFDQECQKKQNEQKVSLPNFKHTSQDLDDGNVRVNSNSDFVNPEVCLSERGKIIFSKIEDIPTRPEIPKPRTFEHTILINDKVEPKQEKTSSRLRFELNFPQKRIFLPTQIQSTFAELSNKLGPTVNFNFSKIGVNHNIKNPLLESKVEETKQETKALKHELKEPPSIDIDNNETEEVVFLKSSKSKSKSEKIRRSKSRSYTCSRSRSRSYSYSSYSRSGSRSRGYSRSRSYSSYSSRSRSRSRSTSGSRSRTRSRSPSIQRRRGSPSFLDKRRITR